MNKELHFKSDIQTWETPKAFFDQLNRLFGFTLDACASSENAKVGNYYTVEQNALTQEWQGVVWCNPPYGRHQVDFIHPNAYWHLTHKDSRLTEHQKRQMLKAVGMDYDTEPKKTKQEMELRA